MRYIIYSIIATLAAIALLPLLTKAGKYLVEKFNRIDEITKESEIENKQEKE